MAVAGESCESNTNTNCCAGGSSKSGSANRAFMQVWHKLHIMPDLGKLRHAGRIRPFVPLCPARLMPIINSINKTSMSFFTLILKFENSLFFFNVCGDLYIIISHSTIKYYQNHLFKLVNLKDFTVEAEA